MDKPNEFANFNDDSLIKIEDDFPDSLKQDYACPYCLKIEPMRVYKCVRKQDKRNVLVKIADSKSGIFQLENEASMLKQCRRANLKTWIPDLIFFGYMTDDKGVAVLVRDYIEGYSVAQLVEMRLDRPGLSEETSVKVIRDVLRILDILHRMNPPVIHRDIKPQNVIADECGNYHLIDFGIARSISKKNAHDTHILGTSLTAPPEQFGFSQTDQRSDIYSTGVLLRYCLTGEYHKDADAEIPAALRQIVLKATQFDPEHRYASAREMLDAIESVSNVNQEKPCDEKMERLKMKNRMIKLVTCLLMIFIGSIVFFSSRSKAGGYVFHEPLIEEAVRLMLDKPEGLLSQEELSSVKEIHIFGRQIYQSENQIDFLGSFPWLNDSAMRNAGLWEQQGSISTLEDIRVLTGLEELCLYKQSITDISLLKGTKIRTVGIGYNPITDLSPLDGNSAIRNLNISCLDITDLAAIEHLQNLESLNISGTRVADLSPLKDLTIQEMNVFSVPVADYSPLVQMPALKDLTIEKLTPPLLDALVQMNHLRHLHVTHANGFSLSQLECLENLETLYYYTDEVLSVPDTPLNFPELRWLDMKNLNLSSLRCVSEMKKLETLLIYASQCTDYSGLEDLNHLSLICCTAEQAQALKQLYPDRHWQYAY